MKLNTDQINAVDFLYKTYGRTEITRSEINDLVKQGKLKNTSCLKSDQYKVKRGVYSLPIEGNDFSPNLTNVPLEEEQPKTDTVSQAAYVASSLTGNIVPTKDP